MGKKGGSGKIQITDYYMSLFYGICHSRIDALLAVIVGEKEAWSGSQSGAGQITIARPDLFGGVKKEGGVSGTAHFLPGEETQVVPTELAVKFGLTSATSPGFRGISSVFFTGTTFDGFALPDYNFGLSSQGFLWGSNNPYLRSIWFKAQRSPKVLSPESRLISSTGAAITRSGTSVTVDGTTVTMVDGIVQLVNGVTLLLSAGVLSVNDIAIVVDTGAGTISIGDTTYDGTTAASNTMTVIASGDTEYSVTLASALDANGAAIIYECLTDTDWGMGASPGSINTLSFEDAATTLRNERFGMSMMWTKQTTIEAFVSEVLDHIQGTLFVNPQDGLLTLKLIRADYEILDLPVLDETNCEITSFDRKGWGETINEIVVTWTNPENEQEETVVAQDLANITIQGAVVSDSRNYYGVRNAELAMQLAKRDLASASAPLATMEIEVDRSAWNFVPGGCAVLNYPEYNIEGLVIRLGKIDYGKPGQPSIKVNAVEDIFSLPVAAYTVPDDTLWADPSMVPVPLDPVRVFTAPAFFLSTLNVVADAQYPDVFPAVIAADSSGSDVVTYDLVQQEVQPNGDIIGTVAGSKPLLGHALLQADLLQEATSLIATFGALSSGTGPFVSGFIFIGNVAEQYQEIALIQSVSETGWTIIRGALDTIPRKWTAGTPIWFVGKTTNFIDTNRVRGETETARYKLLPRTAKGILDQADAPIVGAVLTARPWLPNRPADVKVGGVAFGTLDVSGSPPASLTVTWSNRNRTMEDTVVVPWTDATVTPEVGQTTTVAVHTTGGTLITSHDGITGESFTLPLTSFGEFAVADVKVTSKRDGLESLQGHSIRVRVRAAGWGDTWGEDWGGTTGDTTIPPPAPTPTDPGGDPEPDDPWYPVKLYGFYGI